MGTLTVRVSIAVRVQLHLGYARTKFSTAVLLLVHVAKFSTAVSVKLAQSTAVPQVFEF